LSKNSKLRQLAQNLRLKISDKNFSEIIVEIQDNFWGKNLGEIYPYLAKHLGSTQFISNIK
jgi:hypothetical protein